MQITQNVISDNISTLPLFRGISPQDLDALVRCSGSRVRTYSKGDIIFLEEEELRWAGTVISGEVHLTQENLHGIRTLIVKLHRGELFGESYAGGTLKTSRMIVTAGTDTEVLLLPLDRIQKVCNMSCPFHHILIENLGILLADKNVRLMERMLVVSQQTIKDKIFVYLGLERDHFILANDGKEPVNGFFPISFNRTQLAEYMCTDRTALARELSGMKKSGEIDFEKNMFRIN